MSGDRAANGNGNGGNGTLGNGSGPEERLDSWKAIASYLGRDETTLRRWETERGLPIRRLPGKRGGSVYAYKSEIDEWLRDPTARLEDEGGDRADDRERPAESPAVRPRRSFGMIGAVAGLVLVAAVAWWLQAAPAPIARVAITEFSVTAHDSGGAALWTYAPDDGYRHILSEVSAPVRFIGGSDPRVFAASAIRMRASDNQIEDGQLTAFDGAGRLLWRYAFDDEVSIGGKTFGAPWGTAEFAVEESGARRVALTAHHYTWSPGMVAILDSQGRRISRFVNNGWLEFVRWLPNGRVAVGGYSESGAGGLVALLDPSVPESRTPDETAHLCENCPPQHPLRVIVLPRTEVNLASRSRFNRAMLDMHGDGLVARTSEVPSTGQGGSEVIYEFTADLTLVSAAFNERYWVDHDRLYAEKALDHDRSRCPDRAGPRSYRAWSPQDGWATVAIR